MSYFSLQIRDCQDDETLREVAMSTMDLLLECGFTKPIHKLKRDDRVDIIQTVALHKVILVSLAELQEFREGLKALGVAEALKKHGQLLHPFFCNDDVVELTSG